MEKLAHFVVANDTQAGSVLRNLITEVFPGAHGDNFKRLGDSLNSYDYEAAQAILAQIADKEGVDLPNA